VQTFSSALFLHVFGYNHSSPLNGELYLPASLRIAVRLCARRNFTPSGKLEERNREGELNIVLPGRLIDLLGSFQTSLEHVLWQFSTALRRDGFHFKRISSSEQERSARQVLASLQHCESLDIAQIRGVFALRV
jgi:hypothetical protein